MPLQHCIESVFLILCNEFLFLFYEGDINILEGILPFFCNCGCFVVVLRLKVAPSSNSFGVTLKEEKNVEKENKTELDDKKHSKKNTIYPRFLKSICFLFFAFCFFELSLCLLKSRGGSADTTNKLKKKGVKKKNQKVMRIILFKRVCL